MEYTKRELNHLAMCLGRCDTCSETSICALKIKVGRTPIDEMLGILYHARLDPYFDKIDKVIARKPVPARA